MGQMKQLDIAIHEAVSAGLMPNPFLPTTIYALVEETASVEKVIALYVHQDLALYDAWVCEQDPDKQDTNFFVREMDLECDTLQRATGMGVMHD